MTNIEKEEIKTTELNKYVIEADTAHNEWVVSGEIWKGIEKLLHSEYERGQRECPRQHIERPTPQAGKEILC